MTIAKTMLIAEKQEIESDVSEIGRILMKNQLQVPGFSEKQESFTWVMIRLRDLLSKTEKFARRIDFTEDVIPMWLGTKAEVTDVTSLVKCFRDAMCHPNSFRARVGSNLILTLGVVYGTGFTAIKTPDFTSPQCEYSDECMFICGPQRIYFHRHIVKAYKESQDALAGVLSRLGPIDPSTHTYPIDDV